MKPIMHVLPTIAISVITAAALTGCACGNPSAESADDEAFSLRPAPKPTPKPLLNGTVSVSVRVDETDGRGNAWDVDDSAPDISLKLRQSSGGRVTTSQTSRDTLSASLDLTGITLEPGDGFDLTIYDEDPVGRDEIGSLHVTYSGLERSVTRQADGAHVTLRFVD